jgi:hypothetical protein
VTWFTKPQQQLLEQMQVYPAQSGTSGEALGNRLNQIMMKPGRDE